MNAFVLFLATIFIGKSIVENTEFLVSGKENFSAKRLYALTIFMALHALFGVDILTPAGFDIPYFDGNYELLVKSILSGIASQGGAGFLYDYMKVLKTKVSL